MEGLNVAQVLNIESNQLLNIGLFTDEPAIGIRLVGVVQAEVSSNTIKGLGQRERIESLVGIQAIACNSVRISGNEVVGLGPSKTSVTKSAGIDVLPPFDRLDVVANQVRRTPLDAPDKGEFYGLRIGRHGEGAIVAEVDDHIVFIADQERITYVVDGGISPSLSPGNQSMTVRGNTLQVQGEYPAVDIVGQETPWRGECLFSDNRCRLDASERLLVVRVAAGTIIFSNNYVQGSGERSVAVELLVGGTKGPFTVLGNIANGRIQVNGVPLQPPWQELNVMV